MCDIIYEEKQGNELVVANIPSDMRGKHCGTDVGGATSFQCMWGFGPEKLV